MMIEALTSLDGIVDPDICRTAKKSVISNCKFASSDSSIACVQTYLWGGTCSSVYCLQAG